MGQSYAKPNLKDACFDQVVQSLPSSLQGKNILITGTTSGTGYTCSKVCAEKGATVIVLNRKSAKAETSLKELQGFAKSGGQVDWIECDLQDLASVKAAAEHVKSKYDYLDVVALNAGVMALPDKVTKDGFDVQMQTNVISHFLLTKELFPLLEKGAKKHGMTRIVNHTSIARFGNPPDAKYYQKHKDGELGGDSAFLGTGARWARYQQSKVGCAVFHAALTDKLKSKYDSNQEGGQVVSLLCHPGLAVTDLQVTSNTEGGMGGTFSNMFMRWGQSANDGASPLIMAVASEDCQNGVFWGPGQGRTALRGEPKKLHLEEFFDNEQSRKTFWSACEAAVGTSFSL